MALIRHRLALLVLAFSVAGCGESPTPSSPSPASSSSHVADFSGLWQGQYQVTACTGERDCAFRLGTTRPYVLRLTQSGTSATGILEALSFVVDVEGEVGADGALVLTGSRPGTSGYDGIGAVSVSRLSLRQDAQLGLTGELRYSIDPGPTAQSAGMGTVSHDGLVTGGTRGTIPTVSPTALAAYEGTWTGSYVVESCTFVGWRDCYPQIGGGVYALTLELHVEAGGLAGALALPGSRLAVTAGITAEGLVLRGSESHPVSGGTDVTNVMRWTTARDRLDRLNGPFEYDRTYLPLSGTPNRSSYQARLLGVTRRP